jgi:hypothetical protein
VHQGLYNKVTTTILLVAHIIVGDTILMADNCILQGRTSPAVKHTAQHTMGLPNHAHTPVW